MKKILLILIICSNTFVFSQTKNVKELAIEISKKNLDMTELVSYVNENLEENTEKAFFFYYWIGLNVNYDRELFSKRNQTNFSYEKDYSYNLKPEQVFEKRIGVCSGYSNLYKWFLDELEIENVIVSGHIRDETNHFIELDLDFDYGHSWNIIKLNGKWMIVDTTWGTSSNSMISDFYFDVSPERAIITHYPEDISWQLLEIPLSLEEFNNSKFIKPIWFEVGFSDNPKLKKDNKNYYFVFQNNPNKNWSVDLLFSGDNLDFQPVQNVKKIVQEGLTYLKFDRTEIPEKVFFKVNIFEVIQEKNYKTTTTYEDVINFKI